MATHKHTKRALFASMISILLCVTMLVGSTFAWFTDTASTNVNTIQAGTLDIGIYDNDKTFNENTSLEGESLKFLKVNADGTTTPIADSDAILWEPNATYRLQDAYIHNNGNLYAKCMAVLTLGEGTTYHESGKGLAEVIDVIINGEKLGTLKDMVDKGSALGNEFVLAPNGAEDSTASYGTIELHMQQNAGNEYQGLKIGKMALTVYATQVEAEYDSFDNKYDEGAPYPSVPGQAIPVVPEVNNAPMTAEPNEDSETTTYVYENVTASVTVKVSTPTEGAQAPAPVVTIKQTAETGNITLTEGQSTASYNIKVVDKNNENTQYPAVIVLDTIKNLDDVTVYHNGTAMTAASSEAEVRSATTDKFWYDVNNGKIYMYAASYSNFTVVFVKPEPIKVSTQEELETAITNTVANVLTVIELSGDTDTYKFPTWTEYSGTMKDKNIIFTANGDKTFDATFFNVNGTQNLIGATLTFDGVNVEFPANSWMSNGYTGLNLNGGKLVFRNSTISGAQYLYVPTAEFINCVFENKADSYSVCTYGAENVTFTGCTFNTAGKAVLLYHDNAVTTKVTLTDCTFNSDDSVANDKAAVETGDDGSKNSKFDITFTNCKSNGFDSNNSTSPLWGNKINSNMPTERLNVVIDGVDVY